MFGDRELKACICKYQQHKQYVLYGEAAQQCTVQTAKAPCQTPDTKEIKQARQRFDLSLHIADLCEAEEIKLFIEQIKFAMVVTENWRLGEATHLEYTLFDKKQDLAQLQDEIPKSPVQNPDTSD